MDVKTELVNVDIEGIDEATDVPEAGPRANPCEGLATFVRNQGEVQDAVTGLVARLSAAAAHVRGAFAAPTLGRDYARVEVLEVAVAATGPGAFGLETRARFDECVVDLTIGGRGLMRQPADFEWCRGCLREAYPGAVVPPVTSDVYSEGSAEALERFVSQCLAHPELARAPELACLCSADAGDLARAKAAFAAARDRGPAHVRAGALLLDLVGNDTAVGQETLDDSPAELAAAKRRETDVRELYMWARAQAHEVGRAEREATRGADALRQFEEAAGRTKVALASRFRRYGPSVAEVSASGAPSGPARSLAALREMVGLARALCEAVEARDRVRLQYVCARQALAVARRSAAARAALAEQSERRAREAENLTASVNNAEPPSNLDTPLPPAPTLAATALSAADARAAATPGPETDAPAEEGAAYKALALYAGLRARVVGWSLSAADKVKETAPHLLERVPDRQRMKALVLKGAMLAAAIGLRAASAAASGGAAVSADAESVAAYEKLLADLAEVFDVADARLRADALKLKATWDDLQLQAYDAFVRGESSRADTARAAADGAALSLVNMKHPEDDSDSQNTPPLPI
mmetsp:Transcript_12798/g.38115  ORF Transcript_12798/g.38115 Transcript_12798/m.38115 type:complete len:586 (-) Transcript_12798:76-1833(-)